MRGLTPQLRTILLSKSELALAICVALMLLALSLFNAKTCALFDQVLPVARDVAMGATAVACLAGAEIGKRSPRALLARTLSVGACALHVIGVALVMVGARFGSAPMLVVGAAVMAPVAAVILARIELAFTAFDARRHLPILVWGFLLRGAGSCATDRLGAEIGAVALVAVVLATVMLTRPIGASAAASLRVSEPPELLEVTNPYSFVPFTSWLVVAVFLFSATQGFATVLFNMAFDPSAMYVFELVAAVVVGLLLALGLTPSADGTYSAAFVLLLAGMLTTPAQQISLSWLPSLSAALLMTGAELFTLTTWLIRAGIGRKNLYGALQFTLFTAASLCLGTEAGAALAHATEMLETSSPEIVPLLNGAFCLVFASYNFLAARRLSLDTALAELVPMEQPRLKDTADIEGRLASPAIEATCSLLAQANRLTTREHEVLALLARGRNVAFISTELGLSRNTIRTYVAGVYAKLDLHTHQELIDRVERECNSSATG